MNAALIILIVVALIVLAWNFIPAFREKMRGMSTKIEALIALGMYYFEVFQDALRELSTEGWIPDNWENAVPYIITAYVILKRAQTSTPPAVGLPSIVKFGR